MGLVAHVTSPATANNHYMAEQKNLAPDPNDESELLIQIQMLMRAAVPSERAPFLDEIEKTLTDGYARALQLEAERWRLERRIAEVASSLEAGDTRNKTKELSALAKRLSAADGSLTHLRGMLSLLRDRHSSVRVSAP
jgi:hypothetical protein